MANVSVYNMQGQEVGNIDLNDAVFGVKVNESLLHMAVVQQLANNRQGTQKAKTRAEVSGGGRKPWRQKGTGHARQGSTRAPQWTHGGVVFAPVPRDYSFKMNKKEKQAAVRSALTDRVQQNKVIVLDQLSMSEYKTKEFVKVMENLKAAGKTLVVMADKDEHVIKSAGNIPAVRQIGGGVRIMATLEYYDIILKPIQTEKALQDIAEKRYAFYVHPEANKFQIKTAVERMFEGTKVARVNTMNCRPKKKRRGMVYGQTAKRKKAYVTLTADSKEINLFTGL